MKARTHLIERYVLGATTPYFLIALLLLTAILFAQQATRFAELLVTAHVPLSLLADIGLALAPNVLIFTIPMATLAGVSIGFSRMGSDSELVALRAGGVSPWRMLFTVLSAGILLSLVTIYLNLYFAPSAARTLHRSTLNVALYKLNSPVEPRSFSTDIAPYVVYVRDGDKALGQWGRVFIFSQEHDASTHLFTARSGRIDSAADQSELVMSDVAETSIPPAHRSGGGPFVTERLSQMRIIFNTGRASLLARLRSDTPDVDEMPWPDLVRYAESQHGSAARDAETLVHKRLTLSLAPLILALTGTALGLRVRRGGRGLGVVLALITMLAYYLLSLIGEQMARAGTLPPAVGAWLGTAATTGVALTLMFRPGGTLKWRPAGIPVLRYKFTKAKAQQQVYAHPHLLSFPTLLDRTLLRALLGSLMTAFAALVGIFMIFTLFELWRFISNTGASLRLVGEYLIFLMPMVTVQLLPASVLVSVLATYALTSRHSETVAWWAGGQSVYRLMVPGLVMAALVGGCMWLIQEQVMPNANIRQDNLRARIRGGISRVITPVGRQWLASPDAKRIYSYEFDERQSVLKDPVIYDFDAEGVHLRQIIRAESAAWASSNQLALKGAESVILNGKQVQRLVVGDMTVGGVEPVDVFRPSVDKPSQLSSARLQSYVDALARRGTDVASLMVALQRKYADPFGGLVMAIVGIPLALSFGRRNAVIALCFAVAIGLGFWAVAGGFQQLGAYGMLPAAIAAWSPLVIFASIGTYLLTRIKT